MIPKKYRMHVIFIFLGVLYAAKGVYDFYSTEIVELEGKVAAQENRLEEKQRELKKLKTFADNIEKVKSELRELNLQLEVMLESMPRTFNLSGLLRRLNLLAQNSGLELSTFKPKQTEAVAKDSFYSTIAIDFTIRGSFPQTLVFMDQMARLKRIVNVQVLNMKPATQSLPTSAMRYGATVAQTEVTIRTYRFNE